MPETMRCQPLLGVAFATERPIKVNNNKKKKVHSALETALGFSVF